ncbi:MAG: transcriptional regulator [Acidobacteriota bacterium]|nr:transcriptional regulator [Acidobacteriota bacterium]
MTPEFDAAFLSRARLGIISVLITVEEATFPELKDLLQLTQGNLGAHLRWLEEAGYVALRKEFFGRKPRTTASLTESGRAAFKRHIETLEAILKNGER